MHHAAAWMLVLSVSSHSCLGCILQHKEDHAAKLRMIQCAWSVELLCEEC
jgi:hypothetical protein